MTGKMRLAAVMLWAATLVSGETKSVPFTEQLWQAGKPIYERTLEHPFLRGLTEGTLSKERFRYYLLQDGAYLRAFGQALSLLAAKAPKAEWAATLNRHASEAIQVERELHETILRGYGVSEQEVSSARTAPTNHAYTSHLLAAAALRPFGEGLAAVLPCYWIYWEVGKHLKKKGSPEAEYQRWIDQYASEGYAEVVGEVLRMMEEEALGMAPRSREAAVELFVQSARYEWMFWEMAWRLERWQPE